MLQEQSTLFYIKGKQEYFHNKKLIFFQFTQIKGKSKMSKRYFPWAWSFHRKIERTEKQAENIWIKYVDLD